MSIKLVKVICFAVLLSAIMCTGGPSDKVKQLKEEVNDNSKGVQKFLMFLQTGIDEKTDPTPSSKTDEDPAKKEGGGSVIKDITNGIKDLMGNFFLIFSTYNSNCRILETDYRCVQNQSL